MKKVILIGCNGRMGRMLSDMIKGSEDLEVIAGIDILRKEDYFPVFSKLKDFNGKCDVIIDFSTPQTLSLYIEEAKERKVPVVIATTGFDREEIDTIKKASNTIPIFRSANMSLGINLLQQLVKKAALILNESFDVEITEKHHNMKKDAPSGTALMLAESINEVFENKYKLNYGRYGNDCKRKPNEIGIHAIRGGTIVGEHDVIFAGNDEVITISHSANSRNVFATGAIAAARFLIGKNPGLYNMENIIENTGEKK